MAFAVGNLLRKYFEVVVEFSMRQSSRRGHGFEEIVGAVNKLFLCWKTDYNSEVPPATGYYSFCPFLLPFCSNLVTILLARILVSRQL